MRFLVDSASVSQGTSFFTKGCVSKIYASTCDTCEMYVRALEMIALVKQICFNAWSVFGLFPLF